MKKNKLLIYISLFFCLFMVGITKVKASTYLGCEYTISKKKLVDSYELSHVKTDYKMFIGFIDSKVSVKFTTDNGYSSGKYSDNDVAIVQDDYIEVGSMPSSGCPKVSFIKRFRLGIWTNIDGGNAVETTASEVFKFSGYKKTCSYTEKTTKQNFEVTLNYNGSYNRFGFVDAEPQGVNVYTRTKNQDIVDDYISFWTKMYNGCPRRVYKKDGFLYASDGSRKPKGEDATYELVISDECPFLEDSDYVLAKEYVDSVDIDKLTKTTSGDFVRTYNLRYNAWKSLMSKNSSESLKQCDDYEEIQKKFQKIATKLNELGYIDDAKLESIENDTTTLSSKIIDWDVEYGTGEELDCNEIFDDEVMSFLKTVFTWIRIAIPILLIILGMIDFSQVIISQDPDAMKKCTSKFTKRCIVAIIIFFLPTIIMLILQWINDYVMTTNPDCVIKDLNIIVKNIWK